MQFPIDTCRATPNDTDMLGDSLVSWLIERRLADGRFPCGRVKDVVASRGDGHMCDGCGTTITTSQVAVSAIAAGDWRAMHMQSDCFRIWESGRLTVAERQRRSHALERKPASFPL